MYNYVFKNVTKIYCTYSVDFTFSDDASSTASISASQRVSVIIILYVLCFLHIFMNYLSIYH